MEFSVSGLRHLYLLKPNLSFLFSLLSFNPSLTVQRERVKRWWNVVVFCCTKTSPEAAAAAAAVTTDVAEEIAHQSAYENRDVTFV